MTYVDVAANAIYELSRSLECLARGEPNQILEIKLKQKSYRALEDELKKNAIFTDPQRTKTIFVFGVQIKREQHWMEKL